MSDSLVAKDTGDWDEFYSQSASEIQEQIEQSVCGCDYYGSSWMDADEAMGLAAVMKLGTDSHLLDIGSGSGWPALFQSEKTGCRVTLTDISREGLRASGKKAADIGLGDRCHSVNTGAERLPFASASFDAIGHADVLCCLEEKLSTLYECRRVIRDHCTMAFSVIHMSPGASIAETEAAAEAGPSFIGAPSGYPAMLEQTGWRIEKFVDITSDYALILNNLHDEYKLHAAKIIAQRSEEHYMEVLEKCVAKRDAVADGSVKRSLFTVTPV